jgi:hypothetical protein
VIKKPCTRGGNSPARGLQNTNPQWVVAPVEKQIADILIYFSFNKQPGFSSLWAIPLTLKVAYLIVICFFRFRLTVFLP